MNVSVCCCEDQHLCICPLGDLRLKVWNVLFSASSSVDIWSVGCIMAEMLQGKPLFKGSDRILPPLNLTEDFMVFIFCRIPHPVLVWPDWSTWLNQTFYDRLSFRLVKLPDTEDDSVWEVFFFFLLTIFYFLLFLLSERIILCVCDWATIWPLTPGPQIWISWERSWRPQELRLRSSYQN